ncbi:hypothetical protein ARSEF1564_000738 [Beauveria bassiana]
MTRDVSAFQIAQIHLNICVGMIGTCVQDKPALQPVLDQLMSFEAIGSIFITELGHGLDVKNIETTATLLPDGCFDLHTPSKNAAKAMPPAAPVMGMKRIGIVLARLIVDEEDRGMKLFVVPISDRDKMHSGVTTWLLPVRPGTKPLDHAITAFNHVRLPPESILSSLAKPKDAQLDLHHQLWRLSVGAIALSIGNLNCLQVGTYIAAIYSKRPSVWTSCSKDPKNACSGNNPNFLASSSVGSGGMSACKKGQKRSLCCVSPSPYDVSGKCEWRKKAGFLKDQDLLCEGACSSDQLMLARESGLVVGNEGGDGCYGDLAFCCSESQKQEPRSEDPGSSEGREFQALIRKYMENPTCPAMSSSLHGMTCSPVPGALWMSSPPSSMSCGGEEPWTARSPTGSDCCSTQR